MTTAEGANSPHTGPGWSGTHMVTDADTALALGSGDVSVLGTPRLLAWLEAATVAAAHGQLDEGQTSVGTAVRLRHRRPTAVGRTVTTSVELRQRHGSALTFSVSAADDTGRLIADGEIDRVVVLSAEFG